jgi:hypothetical protein
MEKVFPLVKFGQQLWTKESAKSIRAEVELVLESLEPGDTVVIDAGGVEVFDYSFTNELFGKTLIMLPTAHPERFLVVENLTAYTRENLVKALESRNLIMIERKAGKAFLLGKVQPADQTTFDAIIRAKGPVTSAALSEQLRTSLTAMNERLTKFSSLGLVRWERVTSPSGREQYEYRALA